MGTVEVAYIRRYRGRRNEAPEDIEITKNVLKNNGVVQLDFDHGRPLNYSAYTCLERNGEIISTGNLKHHQNGTVTCWKEVTRRKVVVKYNELSFASLSYNQTTQPTFGYVTKTEKGQVQLRFGTNGQLKRALCARAHSTLAENRNLGVRIGVPVAAVILFIVLASVFVILKRRKKLPNQCMKSVQTEESDYTEPEIALSCKPSLGLNVNPSYDDIDNAVNCTVGKQDGNSNESQPYTVTEGSIREPDQNAEKQNKSSTIVHDYFILEKPMHNSDHNVENNSHNYFLLEKDAIDPNESDKTYDSTRPGNSPKDINMINVYNTIHEAANEEHVHIYNTTKKELQKCDETYDTTESALNQFEACADKCPGETDVDIYNHTDGIPLNCNSLDNTYGIPVELKSSNRDANQQFDKTDQLEFDTYSHLNSQTVINTKQDNPYGLHKMKNKFIGRMNSDGDYDVTHNMNIPSVTDNTYSKMEIQY